jgi:hypothetical protein
MVVVARARRHNGHAEDGHAEDRPPSRSRAADPGIPQNQLRALFAKYDSDDSGSITIEEFRQVVVEDLKTSISMADLTQLCEAPGF